METVEPDQMWKEYLDCAPLALQEFLLFCYQKFQGKHLPPGIEVLRVLILNTEFENDHTVGDAFLLVKCTNDFEFHQGCEFQSTYDAWMDDRNLNYCSNGRRKHWQTNRNIPIASAVIYAPGINPPRKRKPCVWQDPFEGGDNTLDFNNLSIYLAEVLFEEVRALNNPLHWPIMIQTKGQINSILIETMFSELAEEPSQRMWKVAYSAVHWYRPKDREWLEKEYFTMYTRFIEDVPAYQRALNEQSEKRAEVLVKAAQEQAQQEKLALARQAVNDLIEDCFPSLMTLANKQVNMVANAEILMQTQRSLFKAHDIPTAQEILLALNNEAEPK
jgi:hypothetical protein